MSNAATIEELLPLLPSEIRGEIRDRCLQSRARDILAMCDGWIREDPACYNCIYQLPNLDFPWHTPVYFNNPNTWTPIFYVYIWYLFNTYHMPLLFTPRWYKAFGGFWFDYTLFDKFWFQVFGEDWRVVAAGQSLRHPLSKPIDNDSDETVILIVKLNSIVDHGEAVVNNQTQLEWITNPDGSFHRHQYWESIYNTTCQTTIWRADTLNTGDAHNDEDIVDTPEAYRIQDLMCDRQGMSNVSGIEDLIPLLPSEIRCEIRDRCLRSRARDILAMCEGWIREDYGSYTCIYQLPNLKFPWHTPVYFNHPGTWTPVFYIYIWYLFNTYHMPLLFDPKGYKTWEGFWFDYTLFDKFWFQVFGEDWRVVASGQSSLHPLPKPINETVILIVKLNSSKDRGEDNVNNNTHLEWVTNEDGSFHRHLYWEAIYNTTCQTTIWRAHTLNTGEPYNRDDIASTPDAYRIQDLM